MLKKAQITLFFLFGILAGYLIFLLIVLLPLPVNHPLFQTLGIHKPRIVAFLPYFLASRATGDYNPDITTLTYFGVTIDSDGHIVKLLNPRREDPPWYDLHQPLIQNKLKQAKKNNIVLSLSAVQLDETHIASILSSPTQHALNLLSDIKPLMNTYGFTDLNIDIESFHDSTSSEVNQFTTLLKTIKNGLPTNTTLSIDIAPIALIKKTIIDPLAIGKIADYVFIMGYDYHSVLSSNTEPVAPLHGKGIENEFDVATTVTIAKKEIDPQKIILGIPLYGYQWDSLSSTPSGATIPNTGQAASNRRITELFAANCSTCTTKADTLADETDFIWQENAGDLYYHHAFLLNDQSMRDRINFVKIDKIAGIGLWAFGYEGKTILQPLSSYKQTFSFW